jgi:hypothetical protein
MPTKSLIPSKTRTKAQQLTDAFPDVAGFIINREKEESLTLKGIHLVIKRYSTTVKTTGIRISLEENFDPLITKFSEYLIEIDDKRPIDERMSNMYSFPTFYTIDSGLGFIKGAFFYVYHNYIIFNEEDDSLAPMDRLNLWIEYYKKKFKIKVIVREDTFSQLDTLEISDD